MISVKVRAFGARTTRMEKHRTEATEVTEGDLGWLVAKKMSDPDVPLRNTRFLHSRGSRPGVQPVH
jgi:hypothetical protein